MKWQRDDHVSAKSYMLYKIALFLRRKRVVVTPSTCCKRGGNVNISHKIHVVTTILRLDRITSFLRKIQRRRHDSATWLPRANHVGVLPGKK